MKNSRCILDLYYYQLLKIYYIGKYLDLSRYTRISGEAALFTPWRSGGPDFHRSGRVVLQVLRKCVNSGGNMTSCTLVCNCDGRNNCVSSPQYQTSNFGNCASGSLWPHSEVEKAEREEEDMRPRGSAIMESVVLVCQTGYLPETRRYVKI